MVTGKRKPKKTKMVQVISSLHAKLTLPTPYTQRKRDVVVDWKMLKDSCDDIKTFSVIRGLHIIIGSNVTFTSMRLIPPAPLPP